jgi:hypothetical protein
VIGLRGFGVAPWDAPDTSAADEARELAAAAHQAQCDADDAAAEHLALAASSRRLMALAVVADDAGNPDLAARRRAWALIDRRHASLRAIGARS